METKFGFPVAQEVAEIEYRWRRSSISQLHKLQNFPLNDTVVQVLNTQAGLVHLFCGSGPRKAGRPRSLCGKWMCGSKESPVRSAEFADSSSEWDGKHKAFGFCEVCYGEAYPTNKCIKNAATEHSEQMKGGSSSESSSSESESTN